MSDEDIINTPLTRRRLLAGTASVTAAAGIVAFMPKVVRDAIADVQSGNGPGSFDVSKVKHIVFVMQENRSFDHYFGAMSGLRGFSDPNALVFPNGRTVFHQPDPENPLGYQLPFHVDANSTAAQSLPSLTHGWAPQHECWNNGKMDRWVQVHSDFDSAGTGPYTMAYFKEQDIPFHYALANAFTICDNYHCSVMGPTYPNRLVWMTGTIDPNGTAGGPILGDETGPTSNLISWPTMGEILQTEGVSWKVYQQLKTATTAQPSTPAQMVSNLSEGAAHNFFAQSANIQAAAQDVPFGLYQNSIYGSTLFGSTNGTGLAGQDSSLTNPYTGQPFTFSESFEEDCYKGTLPQVSWIVQDEKYTEHPNYTPAGGADFLARKVAAVASNPDIWNSTVFIINYDENDGIFDHVVPPTPPAGTADEFVTKVSPGGSNGGGYPVGAGFRVPCFVVSPWTVGGYVASDLLDHTSCLQLVEQVFLGGQPVNTNISDWRRKTFGDFLSVFQRGDGVATSPADPSVSGIDTNFTLAANVANLATQEQNAGLAMPPLPTDDQVVPQQDPGYRPSVSES